MAQREVTLLRWMDGDPALRPRLCELYADLRHVELATTMVQECLTCHAPPARPPDSAPSDSCARCHTDLHAQYSASSHAQTLSHLKFNTVNPLTRQVGPYGFGELRGIGCGGCHTIAEGNGSTVPSPIAPQESPKHCLFRFVARTAPSKACSSCPSEVARQWKSWLTGLQFEAAVWPPGQIHEVRSPD